jgi:threonine dehydrogenase-like Zn-dependent dehydrogenase
MSAIATQTMRSFVMRRIGETAVVEKAVPDPEPNEAVVRTTAALVCTSDVHTVRGAIPVEPNVTLGHEAVGVVHALGSAVDGFTEGQRVAVGAVTPCFQCDYCQRGFTSQCGGMLGGYKFTGQRDGNMAQFFVVNNAQANLAPIPDQLSDHQAVYATDMLSTGFMGAEHAGLRLGETVVVFAQGSVGLSATIGCRLLGAGMIITVESIPRRQELSRSFGADVVIDYREGDVVDAIMELTDGEGVDAAIEAFGFPQTWEQAIRVTKPGGRVSNIGYHGEVGDDLRVPLEPFGMGMADKQIYGGLCPGGRERLTRIFRLMLTGKVDPTPMTTHEFGFEDIERAFAMMRDKEDDIIKPLIHFD